MKKPLLIAGVATTIGLAGIGSIGVASAATTSSTDKPMSGLVDAIATKFNLNKDDVQKVVDEEHTKMEAQHEQQVKDQLTQLVKDGKLTQAQSDAITAKRAELQKDREANKDSMKNKTEAERKAAMDAKKTELEAWAKQNGIATEYLRYVAGHGPGGHHGHGDRGAPDDAPAPSTSTQ